MKPKAKHRTPKPGHQASKGWEAVADWYDKLVGVSGHDYHKNVILPCALRLLDAKQGESIADICCGQGVLVRPLLDAGVSRYVGVDASDSLIHAARLRHGNDPRIQWHIDDASVAAPSWADASHDAAVCLMAVHDVEDLDGLTRALATTLRPGGRLVLVMMHPCFRIPKRSHWGFDHDQKIQFRRLDKYVTSEEIAVATHPSRPSEGGTRYFHRPLADVINALGKAGLAVTHCEEPCSHRRSQGGGPFSKAEHRAAEEFPLFLAIRATRIPL